jgi:hypothetical protein
VHARLDRDYVLLSIDSGKHDGAAAIAKALRAKHKGNGIPWMTILDAGGNELVTSDGPKGNVGCPAAPDEIAWFRTMLERTCRTLEPADLDVIQKRNEELATKWTAPRR